MPDLGTLLSYRRAGRVRLDPRTGLLALVVVNVVSLGAGFTGTAWWARVLAALLPVTLLAAQRLGWAALAAAGAAGVALLTETVAVDAIAAGSGWTRTGLLVVSALANLVARFLPVVLMAWYVLTTTRTGELMGALARWHLPRTLIIPLAVVLRMVPVLASEAAAIGRSARTRGLGANHPRALIAYRIVPLTLRTVDIGDELTQAGLTRGLDARVPRTCLGRVGATWADAVVIAWCVAAVVLFAVGA